MAACMATTCPLAVLAASLSVPVNAQDRQAAANGAVTVVDSVGTGVTYSILTDTLSSVFLIAQPGGSAAVFMQGRRGKGTSPVQTDRSEVIVLSTATYQVDLAGETGPPGSGKLLARQNVHSSLQNLDGARGKLLFLAQFN